ncbi:uncharacterized protein N0V89_004529 [Didymosphaeria variabile]|uniref:Ricin B lectin domain-containing protein n=1 Tax=Didymosphaeria variabile TaxID=1932322 RepID=A0A9W8XSM4_9PLEO|nr:uncharacterized protein N0V89_004529 [Didymosphaeria variabile]KAJ4356495.1 hypothetical protein N0V89_004529 [Didymosphaeria variabile]
MANFDPNQWYHIYYNQNKNTSLTGSQLYNQTTQSGTAYFRTYEEKNPAHQWQFFPLNNNGFYALRSKASGAEGFLGTKYSELEETPGKTVPYVVRGNISDDSAFWNVGTWKDGTFFLSNKANKTAYHLTRKKDSLGAMTSNISADDPLPGQHFSFQPLSAINDNAFSTVSLPSATSTIAATSSPGSTGNPSNPSGGLSKGAKAGIGVGVALAVLILLVVGGLFLWKRHRRNQAAHTPRELESDKQPAESAAAPRYELPQSETIKYEAYGTPHAELHHDPRPVELPGEIPTTRNEG